MGLQSPSKLPPGIKVGSQIRRSFLTLVVEDDV
jgi:hypothetical protein